MEIFSQNKLLKRLVMFLLLLNVAWIGFFIWKEFHHHEPPLFRGGDYRDVSGILKKELNLTAQQAERMKTIREDFFEKEKILEKTIRSERNSMNALMFNKTTDSITLKSLARNVSDNEYKMELLRIEQAQQLKSICTAEQLGKFENLVIEIRDYFRPDNRPK